MNSTLLLILIPLVFAFGVLHVLPFVSGGRLFGLALPREFRRGAEGRAAVRRYELHLLPWTAAALLAALLLPLSWAVYSRAAYLTGLAWLVPLVAAGRLFSRERAALRRFALPAPSTREARLTGDDTRPARRMLLLVLPLGMLAATAVYLHLRWDDIPARFPVHWGLDGKPNGWSNRTFGGVYGPLLLGAAIIVFMGAISVLQAWGSRRRAQHPAVESVSVVIAFIVAGGFSMAGLLPIFVVPLWGVAVFYGLACAVLGLVIWLSLRRPGTTEVTPDDCWYGDQFYYNPGDPALFVEKRIGLGWTLNFANRLSWLVLAAFILVPLGLVVIAAKLAR